MLLRINKSISFEMRAYLRALQSQMNPHFLYNMLSAIVESGEEENSPRTVAMCMKLTEMMRYIADYNNDRVSFEAELQHARNYLDLMKERYEERFSYEIHADADALPILVPKLIVQPLAENCFKHGFSGCKPPWRIEIRAAPQERRVGADRAGQRRGDFAGQDRRNPQPRGRLRHGYVGQL